MNPKRRPPYDFPKHHQPAVPCRIPPSRRVSRSVIAGRVLSGITVVLGAVLLTGYLGGAIATHVRVQNPLFSHVLFPTYVAAFAWGGLFLRDARLWGFLPFRR